MKQLKLTFLLAVLMSMMGIKTYASYTFNLGSSPGTSSPDGFFTHPSDCKWNFNVKFTGATYDGVSFSRGLKMESSTEVNFTTTQKSTVTIVQSTWSDFTIMFDGEEIAISDAVAGTGCRIYTINNATAGQHSIRRGSGESGLFYIKVDYEESNTGSDDSDNSNIVFADAAVKAICVANWDTNGDGELSKSEAAAVTSLEYAFTNLIEGTPIKSFDEFQYFTGLTSIGEYAFSRCYILTSITIPNNVTNIGGYAFENCFGLTSITIPNNVTSIGNYAFAGCSGLTSITIPNSVTSIGDYAFDDCSGLTSISIPNSVTSIGSSAFQGCDGLKKVIVNDIAAWCGISFADWQSTPLYYAHHLYSDENTEIKNLVIPNSVTSIGERTFYGCSALTSITIGNSVTSIGDLAFSGCSGLTSITIPNSVTSIGVLAFDACYSLTSITIPNSVASIALGTFDGCSGLTSITLPNSVTSIGGSAFNGCSGLTSITIPNSVTSIGERTFYGCSALSSITIPNSVTSIGDYAFAYCSSLTSITIPNSVTSIGNYAFDGCSGLTSITIPNSVSSIGRSAFSGCSGLTSITVSESVMSIEADAFQGTAWLNNQPDGIVYIGKIAYTYKGTIPQNTKANIAEGTLIIASFAFRGYPSFISITIPNSVTSIGDYAFKGCSGLTSIIIPNSVTSIASGAFDGCSGLTSITLPNSVTRISAFVFVDCSGLTSINIPNSVTSIDNYAFYGCSSLTSITIPNSVARIGREVFRNCSSLTSIIIGSNVTNMCIDFWGCSKLKDIYCYAVNCPTVDYDTSEEEKMMGNMTLHVPADAVNQYKSHEVWGKFKEVVAITDEETSIEGISAENAKEAVIYNLNGQRLTKAQKGLYIIDGRKVFVR